MFAKGLLGMLFTVAGIVTTYAQFSRVDTTVQVGKAGYRIITNNKSPEKNSVTIKPIGFDKDARDVNIEIKGRIKSVEVDDLNADGCPDLLMYVYRGENNAYGTVFRISSEKNQSMRPIYFPDILDDAKLREGYKGHDRFMLMEGTLIRRFPLYNTSDTANVTPTGIMRGIQYGITMGEGGQAKFQVLRSYESQQ